MKVVLAILALVIVVFGAIQIWVLVGRAQSPAPAVQPAAPRTALPPVAPLAAPPQPAPAPVAVPDAPPRAAPPPAAQPKAPAPPAAVPPPSPPRPETPSAPPPPAPRDPAPRGEAFFTTEQLTGTQWTTAGNQSWTFAAGGKLVIAGSDRAGSWQLSGNQLTVSTGENTSTGIVVGPNLIQAEGLKLKR